MCNSCDGKGQTSWQSSCLDAPPWNNSASCTIHHTVHCQTARSRHGILNGSPWNCQHVSSDSLCVPRAHATPNGDNRISRANNAGGRPGVFGLHGRASHASLGCSSLVPGSCRPACNKRKVFVHTWAPICMAFVSSLLKIRGDPRSNVSAAPVGGCLGELTTGPALLADL